MRKHLTEWFGVALAASGFMMLSTGFLLPGFLTGLASCFLLLAYFLHTGQKGLFSLQVFFLFANIIGVINNF